MSGDWVFGFGSLVALADLARFFERPPFAADEAFTCRLDDHRRLWNMARDNSHDFAGRPHYVDQAGVRIKAMITSVNIAPAPGSAVNGVVFRVDAAALARLDRREGNYDRFAIDGGLDVTLDGRAWAYRGTTAALQRYRHGLTAGTALVNANYHAIVTDAFATHGAEFLAEYHATTTPPAVPLVPLVARTEVGA